MGARPDATVRISSEPPKLCQLCSRLAAFREANRTKNPSWFNGAVSSFGELNARLLIVGLAPGLKGANRTGRPFTGDTAGELLYATLLDFGFAKGRYEARIDDNFELVDCVITNAVRCVPPQNKPTSAEIATCRRFLAARIAQMTNLKAIIALGRVAHDSTLRALECPKSSFPFAHAALHELPTNVTLLDSFHCSRYNTNTGRLTSAMFRAVFEAAREVVRVP